MPVKWLEAEEIDKSFTSNIRMVESYPNKAAASMLSLAHDILVQSQKGLQILIKPISKSYLQTKWRNRSNRTWHYHYR
jgi:hypothetical protein